MCLMILSEIYIMNIQNGGRKNFILEKYFFNKYLLEYKKNHTTYPSHKEEDLFLLFFNEECLFVLDELYEYLMNQMSNKNYEDCFDVIEALEFIQFICAKAMWKYHLKINETLEDFTRDFDRLDLVSEKIRLYNIAQ